MTIHIYERPGFNLGLRDLQRGDALILTFSDRSTLRLTPQLNSDGALDTPRALTVHPSDMPNELTQRFRRGIDEVVSKNPSALQKWYDNLEEPEESPTEDKRTEVWDAVIEIPVSLHGIEMQGRLIVHGHFPFDPGRYSGGALRWESPGVITGMQALTGSRLVHQLVT